MSQTESALYNLLKTALSDYVVNEMPTAINWQHLYEIANTQGVAAIAIDGLQHLTTQYNYTPACLDVKTKLHWYAISLATEKIYSRQLLSAKELSKIWHAHNIRTLVLKGFAFADYYPKPFLRPASDMDCYLCGKYEEGNNIVEKLGIRVDREDYRHSTFSFHDVFVENHKICTTVRGQRRRKYFEAYLQSLLENEDTKTIHDSYLEKPCDKFNALFFLQHSHRHFLREGITLRYICDWAMLINKANFSDDFWQICEKNDLKPFADSMTRLAYTVCGVKALWLQEPIDLQKQDILLLEDCYNIKSNAIKYGNTAKTHIQIVKNMFKFRWKYKYFSSRPMLVELVTSVWANLFDKQPKIRAIVRISK